MAWACGTAPLSWERIPSVAVEELSDSMGLMTLRSRVSTPLMKVSSHSFSPVEWLL